jgi:hypothetical protein
LNTGALEFRGESMEFAAGVGEMRFADFGDYDATALGANFEAAEVGGGAAQGFVGDVQAVLNARVSRAVEAMGAKKQVEFANGLDGVGKERFDRTGLVAAQGAGIVGRSAPRERMSARTIVEKSCGALYQLTAPISAKAFRPSLGVEISGRRAGNGWINPDQREEPYRY